MEFGIWSFQPLDPLKTPAHQTTPSPKAWTYLGVLVVGYIGVYLCRKNFAVANPLIREAFGLSKEQIGEVASYRTDGLRAGKVYLRPDH